MKNLIHRLRLDREIPVPLLGPLGRFALATALLTLIHLWMGSTLIIAILRAVLFGFIAASPEFSSQARSSAGCEELASRWRQIISVVPAIFLAALALFTAWLANNVGIGVAIVCMGAISALAFMLASFFAGVLEATGIARKCFAKFTT